MTTRRRVNGASQKHSRGTRWPDDTRERALELIRDAGIAAAHHELAVPKATLTKWARAASIDTTNPKTAAATAVRAAQLTEATVTRLEYVIDVASTGLIRRLEANADAGELDDGDLGEWSTELDRFVPPADKRTAATMMRRYQHLASLEPTRDLIGALTRGIHDLALLRGEATERGTLVVNFGIPRPKRPTDVAENVDTTPAGG